MKISDDKYLIVIDNETISRYEEHYFKLHPRAKKPPIARPYHESINEWMIMHNQALNNLKQKWKDFIYWVVNEEGHSNLGIDNCVITHTVYFPTNRRHDNDNTVPKFILDGLVVSGMLVDDDSLHVRKLILTCGVDKEHPRTELHIELLSNTN